MQRALAGQAGVMIGLDYRGVQTIAAFEPVPPLGLGLVAKTDMAEIRKLYLRTCLVNAAIALVAVLFGVVFFRRLSEPLLRRIGEDESYSRAVLYNIADGIVTASDQGVIEAVNPASRQMFGYDSGELAGRNLNVLMPAGHAALHDTYLRRYRETGERHAIGARSEVEGQRKDGSRFPIDLSVSEVNLGGRRAFVGIVRDITGQKRVERLKNEFVSTVSHELRTPLTSIRGSLGLLAGGVAGELPERAKVLVEVAHAESGVKALPDPRRFTQVMANLLSNAVKFSPRGSPVEVSVLRRGAWIRVIVAGQGPGIPDDFRDKIFQKFSQADSSDARQKGGTGLGLSVVKLMVEKMGGSVEYKTRLNRGTSMYFELPEASEAQPAERQPVESRA